MNQITVRGVNFDYAKAGIARAPRRVGKSPNDLLNAINRERLWRRIIIGKRNRAWRHHVLPAAFGFRNNGRCFRQHESRPADCATSKMDKVPIVGVTIDARILTHRRDKHTVAELEVANGERIKKMWHEVYATSFVTPLSSFRRSTC